MKRFDLEKALAGEPVVTRDGRPVTQVTKFDVTSMYCIAAVIDGAIGKFTLDGKYYLAEDSSHDLFMATKTVKKEGWVNLYKSYGETLSLLGHKTKAGAEKNALPGCIATIKIEWEEEV